MHYCWLKILNVVQVFSPAQAVTVCYCCYCCSAVSKQKMPKNPGKTRKYLGFPGYFRVLPALDAGDRRGSLPGLPYCCSAGLTLATVVGEPHCCSVVTVNTSNTVQLPTLSLRRRVANRQRVSLPVHGPLAVGRWQTRTNVRRAAGRGRGPRIKLVPAFVLRCSVSLNSSGYPAVRAGADYRDPAVPNRANHTRTIHS